MFGQHANATPYATHLIYDGPVGQHSHLARRDDERGAFDAVTMLGIAALLVVAYVVGGIAGADAPATATVDRPIAVEQDGGIGGPAAKDRAVATPVIGEFRLGPGNNDAPGIVIAQPQVAPVPGDFRLGPGNNAAPGIVPAVDAGAAGAVQPDDLHGAEGGDAPASAILPFR